MKIGLAYDLKEKLANNRAVNRSAPDDILEEYDSPETVEISSAIVGLGHSVIRLGEDEFLTRVWSATSTWFSTSPKDWGATEAGGPSSLGA